MSYELYYEGLFNGNEFAFEDFYTQHNHQVLNWVRRCPAYYLTDEYVDYFAASAWEKFVKAKRNNEARGIADENKTLNALLSFLKQCVHSTIIDYVRKYNHDFDEMDVFENEDRLLSKLPLVEAVVSQSLAQQSLWALVEKEASGPKEEVIIRTLFQQDLKPKDILPTHGDMFDNKSGCVSRTKENFLKRLKRNDAFKSQVMVIA